MRILLDTAVIVHALRGRTAPIEAAQRLFPASTFITSTINVAEVLSGIRAGEESLTNRLLRELDVYPVTMAIAERGGRLRNQLARKGITLHLPDVLVAATALEFDVPVFTENRKDFVNTGVTLLSESLFN